jgi:formate-dependent nitrite reductase membrane component NrfD
VPSVVNPFTERWIMEPKIQNVWGIQHAIWFTMMGIGGALFINRMLLGIELGKIFGMTWADVFSLILIGVGGLILIADLGKPLRLFRAVLNPRTSWISVGAICDFIFMGFAGLWTLADLDIPGVLTLTGLPWHGNSPLGMAFQLAAALAAVIVIVYPGLVLASSPSIPFWNSALIPIQFLINGFASAFAFALVYAAVASPAVGGGTVRTWLQIEIALVVLSVFLQVAHLLNANYTHVAARVASRRLVQGNLQLAYLGGVLIAGLVVPAALAAFALSSGAGNSATTAAALAGVLVLAGNWLSKFTVIRAGTYAAII